MLNQILPESVVVVATRSDLDAQLFPEEEWIVRRAVERRRREFTTARVCARDALAQLGLPLQPIPAGPRGNPEWPTGIVGSITHCDGYRAAAVAHAREFATIGIDAEPNDPLPDGVLSMVASVEELKWLQPCMRVASTVRWDRLLFCIKETVYKAWFPLTSQSLGFDDARVLIDGSRREFSAQIAGRVSGGRERSSLSGRWLIRDGLIVTAIALRRADA